MTYSFSCSHWFFLLTYQYICTVTSFNWTFFLRLDKFVINLGLMNWFVLNLLAYLDFNEFLYVLGVKHLHGKTARLDLRSKVCDWKREAFAELYRYIIVDSVRWCLLEYQNTWKSNILCTFEQPRFPCCCQSFWSRH